MCCFVLLRVYYLFFLLHFVFFSFCLVVMLVVVVLLVFSFVAVPLFVFFFQGVLVFVRGSPGLIQFFFVFRVQGFPGGFFSGCVRVCKGCIRGSRVVQVFVRVLRVYQVCFCFCRVC